MTTQAAVAGDLLDRVRNQAERMAAQNDGLQKGYADLGWDVLEVAEMQYWRVNFDTFKDYLKTVAERAKITVQMLQKYMLTVRDLSDTFTREQLELMGITKAMKLRSVKDFAIVLPHAVIQAALDPKVTVADLKKITSKELKMPEAEEVDWFDCEMEFGVTADERAFIEESFDIVRRTEPITKASNDASAQMKDILMKLCQEFRSCHFGDGN